MHTVGLKVCGFRDVRSADIALGRHTVPVGPNNRGKTTMIEALGLLFGRDRLVRCPLKHDSHESEPDETARTLCIATLTGIARNHPRQLPTWFSPERGGEKLSGSKGKVLAEYQHPARLQGTAFAKSIEG